MSDEKTKNCGSCVHAYKANAGALCGAIYRVEDRGEGKHAASRSAGPHDCEHWQASDMHRVAEAMEVANELKMMELGLVPTPQQEVESTISLKCGQCGSIIDVGEYDTLALCGTCGSSYRRDSAEARVWLDVEKN
jgi:hypothetical protein